jgi:N-acetylglutamate synthase-like GNAT family acetyltransferase
MDVAASAKSPKLDVRHWMERIAMPHEWRDGTFLISDDPALLDLAVIHNFLVSCYWAEGIPFDVMRRSIENSLPFGVYDDGRQVGFARVVTDYATFAYVGDVLILESHRGRGLSKRLMEVIMSHPRLQGLRRWHLVTRDAHGLYAQSGFSALKNPAMHMELWRPNVYKRL